MPYRTIARELSSLSKTILNPLEADALNALSDLAAVALNHRHGFGNSYVSQLRLMVAENLALADAGTAHAKLLVRMAALMELASCAPAEDASLQAQGLDMASRLPAIDWARPTVRWG